MARAAAPASAAAAAAARRFLNGWGLTHPSGRGPCLHRKWKLSAKDGNSLSGGKNGWDWQFYRKTKAPKDEGVLPPALGQCAISRGLGVVQTREAHSPRPLGG